MSKAWSKTMYTRRSQYRQIVLLSFDLIEPDESPVSLSIASLLAPFNASSEYRDSFEIVHVSVNLLQDPLITTVDILSRVAARSRFPHVDAVAISAYVWSESMVNPTIKILRAEGYLGPIILGGYQIQYDDRLSSNYPDCQIFIKGQGELSFLSAITGTSIPTRVLDLEPDFSELPSPYLMGTIPVSRFQSKVRMETKRGCPYRCTFCAHRDLQRRKVYSYPDERPLQELRLFKSLEVRKINIVDPIFNMGRSYLDILRGASDLGVRSLLALQTRFENIKGIAGEQFLELCTNLNVCLEFGLQTANERESQVVHRRNDLAHVEAVLNRLNQLEIPYEVSLLYGLPFQSLRTFLASIQFLRTRGCRVIKAFPLMLLKGTELWAQKAEFGFRESPMGPYAIPTVVESSTFDEDEWCEMRAVAESLGTTERY